MKVGAVSGQNKAVTSELRLLDDNRDVEQFFNWETIGKLFSEKTTEMIQWIQ